MKKNVRLVWVGRGWELYLQAIMVSCRASRKEQDAKVMNTCWQFRSTRLELAAAREPALLLGLVGLVDERSIRLGERAVPLAMCR